MLERPLFPQNPKMLINIRTEPEKCVPETLTWSDQVPGSPLNIEEILALCLLSGWDGTYWRWKNWGWAAAPDQGSNQLQAVQLIVKGGGWLILWASLGAPIFTKQAPTISICHRLCSVCPQSLLLAVLQQQITVCPPKKASSRALRFVFYLNFEHSFKGVDTSSQLICGKFQQIKLKTFNLLPSTPSSSSPPSASTSSLAGKKWVSPFITAGWRRLRGRIILHQQNVWDSSLSRLLLHLSHNNNLSKIKAQVECKKPNFCTTCITMIGITVNIIVIKSRDKACEC